MHWLYRRRNNTFMIKAKVIIDPSKEFKLTDKKELPKKKKGK